MDISKLLLPREKYAETEKRYRIAKRSSKSFRRGFITFKIKNSKQAMFYFGANHSRNPTNPQYIALRKYWKDFLKTTKGKNGIVLIESRLRLLIEDEKQSIINGSEGSFITLLASRAGIPVVCPDLSDEQLMDNMIGYNKDEILLYWFLRWFNNYQKHSTPKPNFEKSAKMWCEYQKQKSMWKGVKISLPRLKKLYKNILDKDFNENKNPNNLVNPNKTRMPINKVARCQSNLRDLNIVSEITRYWQEGKNIFVVFGHGHLIIQKSALKKLLIKQTHLSSHSPL